MSSESILEIVKNDSFLAFEFNRLKSNWLDKDRLLKIIYKKWLQNEQLPKPISFEP